ncbi:MAG: IS21 family transposase [Elusimicrobiota bacterium]|jgi:predicted transcriptional regulator|nr:IS21 family transposase [Elusimicrobiota bacterium]
MITDEQYKLIRQAELKGLSQRRTAKLHGLARSTVKKYWKGSAIPEYSLNSSEEEKLYEEKKTYVQQLISNFKDKNKDSVQGKQKLTRKMIYNEISQRIKISYPTVCRYINEMNIFDKEAYIPLEFEPGEVMQVDWCDIYVDIKDERIKVSLFCAVLGYSGKIFTMVMPDETRESLFYAHVAAFDYFKGVPKLIFYDNCTTIVDKGTGKDAKINKRYLLLQAHYGFEPKFMNYNSGNEKGLVENLCQHSRKIAFTPIPQGDSLKDVQNSTLLKIDDYNNTWKKRFKDSSIKEMYEVESKSLFPLPAKEFQAYDQRFGTVDKSLLFHFNTCRYSVPYKYIYKKLTLEITPYEIFCWYKGKIVTTHTRSLYPQKEIYILDHYLDILVEKSRAINHAKPTKHGIVDLDFETFRNKCQEKDKLEQLVQLLLLARDIGKEIVIEALRFVNQSDKPTYNAVMNYIRSRSLVYNTNDDPNKDNTNDEIIVEKYSMEDYDSLIPGKLYKEPEDKKPEHKEHEDKGQ